MRILRPTLWGLFVIAVQLPCLSAADSYFTSQDIFDPAVKSHGHVHASAIVVCPDGGLRTVWYENGPDLPSPRFYNTDQDKNDNVRIAGSRRAPGATAWDEPSVMSDTFGTADNNPTIVVDADGKLWLFHSTMLGTPKWTWGSSLLQYKVSDDYQKPGAPTWQQSGLLIPHPLGIDKVLDTVEAELQSPEGLKRYGDKLPQVAGFLKMLRERTEDPMKLRFGWMPRAHPLILADGTLLVPLSNENFDIPMMAMTSDGGQTWTYSDPVPGAGMIQPSVIQLRDGSLQAYFRNGDPRQRIKRSLSTDSGMTWSTPEITELPHRGGGVEAILLQSGNIAMVYNNHENRSRDRLAISISDDQGKTWKWTRQLEDEPGGRFDYPSIVQAPDGTIHVSYSYQLKTIKHAEFNEEWVKAGQGG